MSLVSKLKEGLIVGVLSTSLVLNACTYNSGREKSSSSFYFVPFAVASIGVKHEIYEDENQEKIEGVLNSRMTVYPCLPLLPSRGVFSMKVYGENEELLWRYKVSAFKFFNFLTTVES